MDRQADKNNHGLKLFFSTFQTFILNYDVDIFNVRYAF